MVFQASDYVIWMVFILLETIAYRLASKPEHRSIRAFMGLCLVRDFILLAWSCHAKPYWAISWIGNELEWVALAGIVGGMIGKTRPWRFPAFVIAALCFHYAWTEKWPIYAKPEEMFHLERNCSLIILGTLLVGALFIFGTQQLRLAVALAILTASSAISAQSYLMGNYSPTSATVVWVVGLAALATAVKANAEPLHSRLHALRAAASCTTDNHSDLQQSQMSGATPLSVSLCSPELSVLPCRTQIQ